MEGTRLWFGYVGLVFMSFGRTRPRESQRRMGFSRDSRTLVALFENLEGGASVDEFLSCFPVLVEMTWKLSLNTRFRVSKPSVLPPSDESII